ncbi:MAG: sugar ABC transporter substrate-binding protein [Mycobacterium sp.]
MIAGGRRRLLAGAATAVLTITATACSGSDQSATETGDGGSTSAEYLALAERITQDATAGVVYAPGNGFTPGSELTPMQTWMGPTETPPLPASAHIAFVSCGATVCNETAQAGASLAEHAGFDATLVNINGSADIANINQAMASAIALRPDAIIAVCVTATQVSDKLEAARASGIVTVSTCDPTPTGGHGQFDAAADYANGLSAELLGWGIVADTEGKADVVAIRDEAFPAVVRKIDNLTRVIEDCAGCKVSTATWQITDANNSATAANILGSIINANPTMNTLVLPYSVGAFSAVQAVASSGRDIKIYADDLDAVNQQLLADGSLTMVSSVDPKLAMYQSVDQVIRGLAGTPYVEPADLPYLAHLYSSEDPPTTGVGAFQSFFDYESVYADLWGTQ